jgi:ABC-type hemin transport system substrate-binding protein
VWGANAGLYFLTGRRPATRYIYNFPLIGRIGDTIVSSAVPPGLHQVYMEELAAAEPAAIIIAPDRLDPSSGDQLSRVPQLEHFIAGRYRLVHTDEGYRIYFP